MLESFSKLRINLSRNCYANEQPSSERGFKMNTSSPGKKTKTASGSQCLLLLDPHTGQLDTCVLRPVCFVSMLGTFVLSSFKSSQTDTADI